MFKNNYSQFDSLINTKKFGELPDGKVVYNYTLRNSNGCEFSAMNYGATIQSLKIVNAVGEQIDVVLGFENLENYINSFNLPSPPYFGTTVGRFAGRINNGTFMLNGQPISLEKNHGHHHLHGGKTGFSKVFWEVKSITSEENSSITFAYTSKNGEDHYPGDLAVTVTYTLTENNEFRVAYLATASEDTVINLTQHSYFNLEGHASNILDQKMIIKSNKILATTETLIPTGKLISLKNNTFNYQVAKNCPPAIDTTFVLEDENVAILMSDITKLKMTVTTNQPAVHVYVGGNCFNQIKGKESADYHETSGICFETQNFPDAPNHDNFPNTVLRKGETYTNNTNFKFENLQFNNHEKSIIFNFMYFIFCMLVF